MTASLPCCHVAVVAEDLPKKLEERKLQLRDMIGKRIDRKLYQAVKHSELENGNLWALAVVALVSRRTAVFGLYAFAQSTADHFTLSTTAFSSAEHKLTLTMIKQSPWNVFADAVELLQKTDKFGEEKSVMWTFLYGILNNVPKLAETMKANYRSMSRSMDKIPFRVRSPPLPSELCQLGSPCWSRAILALRLLWRLPTTNARSRRPTARRRVCGTLTNQSRCRKRTRRWTK